MSGTAWWMEKVSGTGHRVTCRRAAPPGSVAVRTIGAGCPRSWWWRSPRFGSSFAPRRATGSTPVTPGPAPGTRSRSTSSYGQRRDVASPTDGRSPLIQTRPESPRVCPDLGAPPVIFTPDQCDGTPDLSTEAAPVCRADLSRRFQQPRRVQAHPGVNGEPMPRFQDATATLLPSSAAPCTSRRSRADVGLIAIDGGRTRVSTQLKRPGPVVRGHGSRASSG